MDRKWIGEKRWSIRERVLITLIFLTAAILLMVALTFHLFIRAYVWNRAAAQLDVMLNSVSASHTSDRHENETRGITDEEIWGIISPYGEIGSGISPNGHGKRKFDGGQDRMTGVRGNVVSLDENGAILDASSEEWETAKELSAYFSSGHELNGQIRRKAVNLDSGSYIISAVRDPLRESAFLICYVDETAIQAFTGQVNLVLGGIICAALILSVFLSRWISRAFAEPVQRLSAFAEEIGQGDFQRREFQFRDAEFNALAESMNRMADELKEANRKQETFFQNVSHELRTPLTAIRGNAEGIVYGLMDPQTSGHIILAEADRLAGFVEDILYLSRMGRAAPEGSVQPLDLRDVLSLCVSEQRTGKISFAFDFDDAPVQMEIRERDARQLFGNLISNAIRYASETVQLSCHKRDGGVWVRVQDDGPGIAPEDLPHIFERFYKGAGGKHGIGLSIVQTVVDTYGGKITVESGGGAAFTVWFPAHEQETERVSFS